MRTDFDLSDIGMLVKDGLVRLTIEDHLGAMQDYSAYFAGGTIDCDHDRNATQAVFRLNRDPAITPYVAANQLLGGFRDVLFEVSVTERFGTPDYIPLFQGKIDNEGWGGDGDEIVVPCTDLWGVIQRKLIAAASYGHNTIPVAIQTVMQSILTNNLSPAPTLVTVGNPNATLNGIVAYDQARALGGEALNAHRNLIGWDLRYLWDESAEEFQLTFYAIDRAKTTPDHTFTTDDYFDVPEMFENNVGIRNRVAVKWKKSDTTTETVTVNDTASQTEIGEIIEMELDATSDGQVRSTAIATALATAAVTDLAVPAISAVYRAAFFPSIEIGDLYRWLPNNVHHSGNLDLAVAGYTHEFYPVGEGQPKTTMRLAGRPKAGTDRWFTVHRQLTQTSKLVGVQGTAAGTYSTPQPPTILNITPVEDGTSLDLSIVANTSTNSLRFFAAPAGTTDEAMLAGLLAATPREGNFANPSTANDVLTGIAQGDVVRIWAVGYGFSGGGGPPGAVYPTQWTRPNVTPADDSIGPAQLKLVNRSFTSNIQWTTAAQTAGNNGRIGWSAGTIVVPGPGGNTTYTIVQQATTVTVSALLYIYLDPSASTTVLQVTTTPATALGDGKLLLAWVQGANGAPGHPNINPIIGTPRAGREALTVDAVDADVIRGNIITGFHMTAWTMVVGRYVQSANFVTGLSGWRLEDDLAELNDVIIRGELDGATGTFAGTVTANAVVAATSFTAPQATFNTVIANTAMWARGGRISASTGIVEYCHFSKDGIAHTPDSTSGSTPPDLWWGFDSGDLSVKGDVNASAGAVATYLTVIVNGTERRVPCHATA